MAFFKRFANNRKNKTRKKDHQEDTAEIGQIASQLTGQAGEKAEQGDASEASSAGGTGKSQNSDDILENSGINQEEIKGELESLSGFFTKAPSENVPMSGFFNSQQGADAGKSVNNEEQKPDLSDFKVNLPDVLTNGQNGGVQEKSSNSFNDDLRNFTRESISDEEKSQPEYSLAFADLSEKDDLTGEYINNASEIYGIKYPAGFDIESADFNGRAIDHSDFSQLNSLRWRHIAGASDITGIIFPAEFDVENCNFLGRNISGCDFGAVYALRWCHIENAGDISAIKYPPTFDIASADFSGRIITSSDFSLVRGLTFDNIKNATEISGIKYPADYDIENADYTGKSIAGSDFSLVRSLKWDNIKSSYNISSLNYPAPFDSAEANYSGRNISSSDFTKVSTLRWQHIKYALDIKGLKYPEQFDIENADFSGRNISDSNFSRVSALAFKNIKNASDIKGLIYPKQFDIKSADFTGKNIDYSDFSNLSEFDQSAVEFADSRKGVVYPAGFEIDDYSLEAIQGAMLYLLAKIHNEAGNKDSEEVYSDAQLFYPGMEKETIDRLLKRAYSDLSLDNGETILRIKAKSAMVGEKLFLAKIGFKILVKSGMQKEAVQILKGLLIPICKSDEIYRMARRIEGLSMGEFLTDEEQDELGLNPVIISENFTAVEVEPDISDNADNKYENEIIKSTDNILNGEVYYNPETSGDDVHSETAVYDETTSSVTEITLEAEKSTVGEENEPQILESIPEQFIVPDMPEENKISTESIYETQQRTELPVLENTVDMSEETYGDLDDEVSYVSVSDIRESNNNMFFNRVKEPVKPPVFNQPVNAADSFPVKMQEQVVSSAESQPESVAENTVTEGVPTEDAGEIKRNVVLPDFSPPSNSVAYVGGAEVAEEDENLSSEERKAVRTGVMAMLLYIKRNSSDDKLSFSELSKAFLKIYPSASIKEASAMAQFSSNVLSGSNAEMRDKLFSFALKAHINVKRFLLEYSLEQYRKSLADWDDEKSFLVFLKALCETIFDENAKEEYEKFINKKGILTNPDTSMKPEYKAVPFKETLGRVNLFSNENFPYYRTLEMVGFSHTTFEALSSSLKIEVSDDKPYNDIANLVFRDVEPGLRQFIVIDSSMGFLYVEKRVLDEWKVEESDLWRAAERNMESVEYDPVYCFSTYETTPYRYIQDDLASYVLYRRKLLKKLAGGKDMLIGVPCRETVYLDTYSFLGAKAMLNLVENHNNEIVIDGEEYEHNVAGDIFIYRVVDGTLDRIRNEDYILLSDSDARYKLLNSVAPEIKPAANLSAALKTDEVKCMTEKEYVIQEAVYTVLKLYTYMNGENDYTVAENAMMGIFDDVSIAFDAQYPKTDSGNISESMEHLDECAEMVASGGKTVSWLLVQAFEKLCEKESYETATAANIRKTVLNATYGESANIVWLSAGAAKDFERRFESTKRFHEKYVENAQLFFLDSEVETVMHALTLMFHQFGSRYALGQVRRHIVKIIPNIVFNYEQSQSAWLPEKDSNIELEVQSLGMVIRSMEPRRKEAIFKGLADAVGDTDLKNCAWPLMIFAKIAKNAYLDPGDAINRYFAGRATLIPTAAALKAMSFKDLNSEFLKHSRLVGAGTQTAPKQPGEASGISDIPDPLEKPAVAAGEAAKPDIQFAPRENLILNSELTYIIEPSENPVSRYLNETAYSLSEFFRVGDEAFNPVNDPEGEILGGMLRSVNQLTTLRSVAWTLTDMLRQQGRDLSSVNTVDVDNAAEYVRMNNGLTYRLDELYPALCGTPVNQGLYIPIQQEYIFFAQSNMPDTPIASLFSLQQELSRLIPVMRVVADCLKLSLGGVQVFNVDILCDTLAAWCALSSVCGKAFAISKAPENGYSLERVKR